uniref:Variant surface glycoprotein 1125.4141 n=1 Tax=Trypanosoma brucei TaxID=5691 RepID=A0A1J0RA42_9TRYP|nr:variant surface glycoprotein 1125.4141 [Trypanosoma brucei]
MKPETKALLMLAALLNVALVHKVSATEDDAVNLADLDAICQLIETGLGSTTGVDPASSELAMPCNFDKINMSLSLTSWRNKFTTDASKRNNDTEFCKAPGSEPNFKQQWTKWESAAIAAAKTNEMPGKKLLPAGISNGPVGMAARLQMTALVAEATKVVSDYNSGPHKNLQKPGSELATKLNGALFGKQTKPTSAADACEGAAAASRETTCKITATPSTVCRAAVFLCAKKGVQTKDTCGSAATGTIANWNNAKLKTAYQTIHPKCLQAKSRSLTAANLRAALTNVLSRIKTHPHSGSNSVVAVLGTPTNQGANCATSDGAGCLDFTDLVASKAARKITTNTWISEIEEAATILEQAEDAMKLRTQAVQRLEALDAKAQAIYTQLTEEQPQSIVSSKTDRHVPSPHGDKAVGSENNNKKNCEKAEKCKWQGTETEGKCIVDESKVTTQGSTAGTGAAAGTNTEGKKCSEKKTEGECEDGCKWNGKECKDSSILVEKQFALMVSAFVSIL